MNARSPEPAPATSGALPVSVCLPTYGREAVLVDTVAQVLWQRPAAAEVLVVDQTPAHEAATTRQLEAWAATGAIRWIRLAAASQPGALNAGLRAATQPFVLFLDDDIRISEGFIAAHLAGFETEATWAVAGQVLQPGQQEDPAPRSAGGPGPFADLEFPFNAAQPAWVTNAMSGNLSVRRERALAIGGFDEGFVPPVSYRFDSDFARRLVDAGGRIRFDPRARLHHLRAGSGGTRAGGSHLTSASPRHGVGDYYFALRHATGLARWRYLLRRPLREVATRFHARHPWYIPVKLTGELRALLWAFRLHRRQPR